MRKICLTIGLLTGISLLFNDPALAEVPLVMSYQGKLLGGGQPVTGARDFIFSLYDAATSGTLLWTETQTGIAVNAGLFNAYLGSVHPLEPPDFAGDVWLEVSVNGTLLSPRQRIVSVGYALRTLHADTAVTSTRALSAANADRLGNQLPGAFAAAGHTHAAGAIVSGMLSDARVTDTLTVSALGSVDGGAIKTGTVADARIAASIARDSEIMPSVLAADGAGSGLDADTVDGKHAAAFANSAHTHAAGDTTSGMFSDARITDTLTVSALGSVNGGAIKSGTVADARVAATIARDSEIFPAVLAGDGPGSGLDADLLDGLNSSAFMPAATDQWVNTTGDSMSGPLAITGGTDSNDGMLHVQNAAGGTASSAEASGTFGIAVRGRATASGPAGNVGGAFDAGGDYGIAVQGVALSNGSGPNYGGDFHSYGLDGIGVFGGAFSSSGTGCGVRGTAVSPNGYAGYFEGRGYFSGNVGIGKTNPAARLDVEGSGADAMLITNTGNGRGATFNATNGTALWARTTSGPVGVLGEASATGNVTNYGGNFTAAGDRGRGVQGTASATGSLTETYGGYFTAAGFRGRGVYGEAPFYGGYFTAGNIGVYGDAPSNGGEFYARGNNGVGVYASAAAAGLTVANIGGEFRAFGTLGVGVRGMATEAAGGGFGGGTGVKGKGGAFDFYAEGPGINYAPFTGAHEVQFAAGFPADPKPGLIVVTAGPSKIRRDEQGKVSLSSTLATVRLADRPNDNSVFGVLVRELPLPKDHWYTPAPGERFGVINALGEGRVWVCDAAGPIQMGDYITTSAVPGYGQKQADDVQHNYTLGKVIESIDWNNVSETINDNGQIRKVYLIGIVYTSG